MFIFYILYVFFYYFIVLCELNLISRNDIITINSCLYVMKIDRRRLHFVFILRWVSRRQNTHDKNNTTTTTILREMSCFSRPYDGYTVYYCYCFSVSYTVRKDFYFNTLQVPIIVVKKTTMIILLYIYALCRSSEMFDAI